LAALYRVWADATLNYPRTWAMLMGIADGWIRRTNLEDARAEQDKMKM
jgi:hypothetical protein